MIYDEIIQLLKKDILILDSEFDVDTDLFEEGLMDSFATMHLFMQLESKYGLHIDLSEIEIEDFSTVRKIGQFVMMNC